jgi:hypothetical protein
VKVLPVPSNVRAAYTSGTLTLTGDANANSITVTYQGGKLTVQGANGTTINSSTSFEASATARFAISADLGDGDDGISMIGVNGSLVTLKLGAGNDKAALTLSNVQTLSVDGGTGTDALATVTSTIGTAQFTSVP